MSILSQKYGRAHNVLACDHTFKKILFGLIQIYTLSPTQNSL